MIELMIVIAIIGILAAVGVPQYKKYVVKAGMAEALSLTNEAKNRLVEYYVSNNDFPPDSSNFSERNHFINMGDFDSYNSKIINGFWWGRGGVHGKPDTSVHIAVRFHNNMGITTSTSRPYLISTLELVDDNFVLICGNTNSRNRSTTKHEFLPATCHN